MKILKALGISFLAIFFFASCQKELSVEDGGITAAGSWQFIESGTLYTGNVDSAVISSGSIAKTLTIKGATSNQSQKFSITLLSAANFAPGSYKASLSQAEFKYFTQAKTIFEGDFLTGEFDVIITTLSNNRIEGTFSGQAIDSTGTPTQILSGKFTSSINLSGNGGGATDATGIFNSTADSCAPYLVNGTYTQGVALNNTNTVQVEVNVATAGAYSITTNTVNGVSFSASGNFVATGVQNVILTGSGTPIDSALFAFTVSFKTSTCNFSLTFLSGIAPPPPVSGDYFPTTANSFWAYNYEDISVQDSLLATVNAYSPTINGQVYSTFFVQAIPPSGFTDTLYYRKANGEYFQAIDLQEFFVIDAPVIVEYIFLKDNVAAGTTFQSPEFTAAVGGFPVTGYVETTILEKASTAMVNSITFNDVIKVKNEYFISTAPGFPALSVRVEERWFAKGIGLIYSTSETETLTLRRYQVN